MGAMGKEFIRYVSFSILGMLGSAGTILADTMFVSNKLGTEGPVSYTHLSRTCLVYTPAGFSTITWMPRCMQAMA